MFAILFFLYAAIVLMKRSYFDFIVSKNSEQESSESSAEASNMTRPACVEVEERGIWITNECRCIYLNPIDQGHARTTFELIFWIYALFFLIAKLAELYRTNWKFYLLLLLKHTTKMLFILSLVCVLLLLPMRLSCSIDAEEILTVLGIVLMSTYFLYFGRFIKLIVQSKLNRPNIIFLIKRAFKRVGTFICIMFKILFHDLSRFLLIYSIFVIGFSQGE
jgi:hypothetical protein